MSENTTADTTAKETTQDAAQLTINDLVAMKSIIDIASQRGTFKPNEMTVVGQTYTKLMAFLETVKQQGETK
jgi:ABC-type transporter lipoprotein component MlaA